MEDEATEILGWTTVRDEDFEHAPVLNTGPSSLQQITVTLPPPHSVVPWLDTGRDYNELVRLRLPSSDAMHVIPLGK